MSDRTVDAIKAKIALDSSSLKVAQAEAAKTGAAVKEHMTAATTHTLRFKESMTSLTEHIAKMPPIVGETARSLESMTSNASAMGPMGIAAAGAAAAVGLLAEAANVATEKFVHAAEATHNLMRVTGESADTASRQIDAFSVLGVGADVATAAMVKLDKAIATQPAHLEKLGITIARNAAGNVDMTATLGNIADAYNSTADAAKKTEIVLASFGKSGAALIPILEQGSAGLKKMEADAKVVMTDQDIENVHKYAIQEKEANRQTDALFNSFGRLVTTLKGEAFTELNRQIYVNDRLAKAHLSNALQVAGHEKEVEKLTAKFREQFDAGERAKTGLDTVAAALKATQDASDAAAAAFDRFVGAEEAASNADIALQRANIAVAESQGKVDKAAENVTATIAKYGAGSDEATLAAHQLTSANLDQEAAYRAAAAAAKKLQEDTDVAATGQKNAALDAKAYIDKLQDEANTLAPGSPLRANLEAYIGRLNDEALKTMTTTARFDATVATESIASYRRLLGANSDYGAPQVPGRASGGPVVPGGIYTIGERGPETLVMGAAGGQVIPDGGASSGTDVSGIEARLDRLIAAVTAQPSGQTGVEAALYKAVQGAGLNRMRGSAGA